MSDLPYEYSEKEIQLMKTLDMLDVAMNPSTPPTLMYLWMGLKCFREDRQDSVSKSVRSCLLSLDRPMDPTSPKRLTPEFDAMIELS